MLETGENNLELEIPIIHHQRKKDSIPKGYLPIKVGQGEVQQKIVVPVIYLNHPLFSLLLKEAEEEYGFDQQGTIIIPCNLEEFRYVQKLIHRDMFPQHHHHHVTRCFRASSQQGHL